MTTISLVTGASRGLGRNTALNIARKGGDVIITYQQREAEARAVVAEVVALGRRAVALQLDAGATATFVDFARACVRRCSRPGSASSSTTWSITPGTATWRPSPTCARTRSTSWSTCTSRACSS